MVKKQIGVTLIVINFNKENYIKECINSLKKQTMKQLEVVIVDDGSTDNSVSVIKKEIRRYKNFRLIEQKNGGPGAARNTGLSAAKGEYIAFLDSDDTVDTDVYKSMFDEAKKHNADTVVGDITCFNEKRTWRLMYMDDLFKKNLNPVRHIRTSKDLHVTPSVCNKLFKKHLLEVYNIMFDQDLRVGEDLLFTQKALFKSNRTVVIDKSVLNYRVEQNGASLVQQADLTFFEGLVETQKRLVSFHEENNTIIRLFPIEKRQWVFFCQSIINKRKKFTKKDIFNLYEIGEKYIQSIHYKNILTGSRMYQGLFYAIFNEGTADDLYKLILLMDTLNISRETVEIKDVTYSFLVNHFPQWKQFLEIKGFSLCQKVEDISLSNDTLKIKGFAFINGISTNGSVKKIVFKEMKTKQEVEFPLENVSRKDVSYVQGNNHINYDESGYECIFENLSTLLDNGSWSVWMTVSDRNKTVTEPLRVGLYKQTKKTRPYLIGNRKIAPYYKKRNLSFRVVEMPVTKQMKFNIGRIKRVVRPAVKFAYKKQWHTLVVYCLYFLVYQFMKSKELWLIGERQDTAQDNSYHLFKYIRRKYPQINAYYVIDKNSPDYNHIAHLGHVVQFGSIIHSLILLLSTKTINSYSEDPHMYTDAYRSIVQELPEIQRNERIFLQHGVIGVSRVSHVLHKNKVDYKKFVVSSEFEKEHIISEFGYGKDEVIVTGLPRWDALVDESKGNEILLMPTWRSWNRSKEALEESEYWERYMKLLHNKNLHELLEKKDLTLTFYPHYQTQLYMPELKSPHERIKVMIQGEETVQSLLKRHSVLITDYSTVSFDFSYLEKPVLFYQFDYNEFYTRHYNEGPITQNRLFGPVTDQENEVISILENMVNNRSKWKKKAKQNPYIIKPNKSHTELVFKSIIN